MNNPRANELLCCTFLSRVVWGPCNDRHVELTPRIANHLQTLLDDLNQCYKGLTDKEADVVTDSDGSPLGYILI